MTGTGAKPMQKPNQFWSAVVLGVLLAVGLWLGGVQVKEAVAIWKKADRVVSVKGLSEREVKVDLVLWPLTYTVSARTLDELYEQLRGSEEKIRSFLVRHGFDEAEMTSVSPTVTDRWENYYGDNPPAERYTAQGVVLLRTNKVDLAKETMPKVDELVREGVLIYRSWEHQPQFIFTRLNDIKPDMIAEATREARKAAMQFAQDSGSRVGKIRTASQGYFSIEDLDAYTPEIKRVRVVTTIEYYLED